MEFEEKIKEFTERIKRLKNSINTEEATKTSLIMPFFHLVAIKNAYIEHRLCNI